MTTSNEIPTTREEGFDLLTVVLILAQSWRLIALCGILCGGLALLVTFAMQPRYTATSSFIVQEEASTNFFSRQNDPSISLLQSNALAGLVLQRPEVSALVTLPRPVANKEMADAVRRGIIRGEVRVTKSAEGLYTVQVQDPSPKRAIVIANAYLDCLQDLNDKMDFDASIRGHAFYEQQVNDERAKLEKAEADLKAAQERTGILQVTAQTGLAVAEINSLRAQIVGLQVQRANMATSATAENPEMKRLDAQIAELQGKVGALEAKIRSSGEQSTPSLNLEVGRMQREVAYHETLLSTLAAQLERARLQEQYHAPRVRPVDHASMPVPKTWPKRFLMTFFGGLIGILLALCTTGVRQIWKRMKGDPDSSRKLREIRLNLTGRA